MVAGVVGGGVGQVLGGHQCCSKDRGGDLPHGQGWWAVVLQLSVGITGADKSMKTVQIKSDNECRSFLYYFDACCGGTCDKWILQWGWEETIPAITLITLHTSKSVVWVINLLNWKNTLHQMTLYIQGLTRLRFEVLNLEWLWTSNYLTHFLQG